MDEEIKLLANKTVDKIYRKVRRAYSTEFHRFGTNIGIGADGTPTKYVDKLAENVAIKSIKKADMGVNILSEEAGFLDFGGEYTFVLDPVDGTRNAYRGIPFYSVSLGVGKYRLSDIEYGIVKNIPTGEVFFAEKEYGAFLNKKRISVPDVPAKEILSSITLGKNFDALTLSLAKKGVVRSLGSASLEMCMVAMGALDFYVIGKEYLRVTDIAASTLIMREAGGVVTDIHGEELDMSLSLDERTSVIAACSKELIHKIIS
jgi:fructose-1,6-bisphosphatase/inositol monophosphatase family enzyme